MCALRKHIMLLQKSPNSGKLTKKHCFIRVTMKILIRSRHYNLERNLDSTNIIPYSDSDGTTYGNIDIIRIYAPTTDKDYDEVEKFYAC